MNAWLIGAGVLSIGLVPCGIVMTRASASDALVALELAGTVATLVFLLLAEGLHLSFLQDVALTSAFLSFPAGLVFAHFVERWP